MKEGIKALQENTTMEIRMLDVKGLMVYLGLGKNKAVEWAKTMKAERRYGKRILYDKKVIDAELDKLQQ